MSDRYCANTLFWVLVTDWGYQVLDMETGELFANELPRQWVNVHQQGVGAMERINQNANNALVDLGETQTNPVKVNGWPVALIRNPPFWTG